MSKYDIKIRAEQCSGCLRCLLACSDLYTKSFKLSCAKIMVSISDTDYSISFSEECNKCGVCADNCFYGALQKSKREEDE